MKRILILLFVVATTISAQDRDTIFAFAQLDTLTQTHKLIFQPAQRITFSGDDDKGFSISWDNGKIEIIYDKNATPTESMKKFWEWLEEYIEMEYYIIKKRDLNVLLKVRQ